MAYNFRQGLYTVQHPEKYEGDHTRVIYRSSWELKLFRWLDTRSSVVKWSSEEVVVPYMSPLDGKMHRYFVDVKATLRLRSGALKTYLIEVKPSSQVEMPKKQIKNKRDREVAERWIINKTKWKAAEMLCEERGWEFMIMDEHSLGIK